MAAQQRANAATKGVKSEPPLPERERDLFEALHHPWRIRILDVLAERNMSVAQFVDQGLISDLAQVDRHLAISKLAYHFRVLRHAGVLEVVEQHSRRGSTEMVCRATARAYFTDDRWAKLSPAERQGLSQFVLHELIARAESAVQCKTFDSRFDRHLSWLAMEVDEQGWSEMAAVLNGVLETVSEIHRESKGRIEASGERPIRTTWGQLHFESPPLLAPPATD
jgi:DNA-binding transcriptional ArsR family regulator